MLNQHSTLVIYSMLIDAPKGNVLQVFKYMSIFNQHMQFILHVYTNYIFLDVSD